MTKFSLPFLGQFDTSNLEEYYNIDIVYNGNEVQIDLNFASKNIDVARLEIVKHFIETISEFDKKNKEYIKDNYADENCDTVRAYVEYHLEDFDEDELAEFINFEDITISPEIQLINPLRLKRIGFYPESEENFAIFDYSLNPEITDELVVIFTKPNGEMNYMAMES